LGNFGTGRIKKGQLCLIKSSSFITSSRLTFNSVSYIHSATAQPFV